MSSYDEFDYLRKFALMHSLHTGVRLSHRPDGLKLDEGSVKLLPDIRTAPDSDLMVGDCVTLDPHRMVPWHHTMPHDLKQFGPEFGPPYQWRPDDLSGWQSETFLILSFAEASSSMRRDRPHVTGLFVLLAAWVRRPESGVRPHFANFMPFGSRGVGGPLPLHWIGCLHKTNPPIR